MVVDVKQNKTAKLTDKTCFFFVKQIYLNTQYCWIIMRASQYKF